MLLTKLWKTQHLHKILFPRTRSNRCLPRCTRSARIYVIHFVCDMAFTVAIEPQEPSSLNYSIATNHNSSSFSKIDNEITISYLNHQLNDNRSLSFLERRRQENITLMQQVTSISISWPLSLRLLPDPNCHIHSTPKRSLVSFCTIVADRKTTKRTTPINTSGIPHYLPSTSFLETFLFTLLDPGMNHVLSVV